MNWFRLSFIVMLVFAIFACGDDDEDNCTQADWVGTYAGTLMCDTINPRPVTVLISAIGSDTMVISYEVLGQGMLLLDTVPIEGCKIKRRETSNEFVERLSATLSNGNIEAELVATTGDVTERCNIVAEKQ